MSEEKNRPLDGDYWKRRDGRQIQPGNGGEVAADQGRVRDVPGKYPGERGHVPVAPLPRDR